MKAAAIYEMLATALMLAAGGAHAQVVNDPMRPPSAYLERDAGSDTTSGRALVLQSVKISGAERIAIVSGETVRQGDKLGSATVVKIADGEVVLKDGDTEQVLKLFPEIDKRAADKRAGARDTRGTAAASRRSGTASGGAR
ncbi:MAG TPA: MSHA biogenesis protein MshK [Burkholderiales bacterium]|nr:MSHA biogenesis protein MshK [Burkholderiales bacterium]